MPDQVVDPLLDPDLFHELLEKHLLPHAKEYAGILMASLAPKGYFIGNEPEKDRGIEFITLAREHDRNLDVALGVDPETPVGDMKRAQDALFREEELKREFKDAPSTTPPA